MLDWFQYMYYRFQFMDFDTKFTLFLIFAVFDHELVSYRSRCKGAAKSALTAVRYAFLFVNFR